MNLNFLNIRAVDGKQGDGFEEFCCQLFHLETKKINIPNESEFIRVRGAGGDGGVEAYWVLPNGDEIGIQAKYIFSLDDKKWPQISKSVKKTLDSHPKIKKYIICIPIDLTNPNKDGHSSQRDKLNEKRAEWKKLAEEKNINIEFEFWGSHELFSMIPKYEGLQYFWFNQTEFTEDIFNINFDKFVGYSGNRYKPDIHIKQDDFDHFEYLGQTEYFKEILIDLKDNLVEEFCSLKSLLNNKIFQSVINKTKLKKQYLDLIDCFESITEKENSNFLYQLDYKKINNNAQKMLDELRLLDNLLFDVQTKDKEKDGIRDLERYLRNIKNVVANVKYFSESEKSESNNEKLLFLKGEGGKGKTHLFASIVDERKKQNLVSLIFDGEHINPKRDITQELIHNCGLNCTNKQFLGALDSAAENSGYRGIIFIDALNESENYKSWKTSLGGFINELKNYPNLAAAVSYRTTYQKNVLSDPLTKQNKNITFHAPGFENIEITKLSKIFNAYSIDIMSVPTLKPEFFNPLFLITFCECLQNKGIHQISDMIKSYTDIFNFYLDTLNDKISEDINLDVSDNLVQKSCKNIAALMAERKQAYILKDEAVKILKSYHDEDDYEKSLLKHLLSSGIIYKHTKYNEDVEVVRFSFDRFSDHIIVQNMLDKYLDLENPIDSFKSGSPLHNFITDSYRYGWLEALAIQLPEKTNGKVEILDVCSKKGRLYFGNVDLQFLSSLKWRNPKLITQYTKKLLFDNFNDEKTLEIIIYLSIKGGSEIFNADKLHKSLEKFKLFKRDYVWTSAIQTIYQVYEDDNIVKNVINWAWETNFKTISNEIAVNYAVILSWFLTASNRELRDKSTRALVNIFINKLSIVPIILDLFSFINDPYVIERVYCSVYGAVLRTKHCHDNFDDIKVIAQKTYDLFFKNLQPPQDIMSRDYARGIIEQAVRIGLNLDIEYSKINPPYKSNFPKRFPSVTTIKKIYGDTYQDRPKLLQCVYSSVRSGDWGIYILSPHINHITQNSELLTLDDKAEDLWEDFKNTLSEKLKKIGEQFYLHDFVEDVISSIFFNLSKEDYSDSTLKKKAQERKKEMQSFIDSLSQKQKKEFDTILAIYKNENKLQNATRKKIERLNKNLLDISKRWILKRVSELCDYKKIPEDFPDSTPYIGRNSPKIERFGKKYQWIALHELLAFLTDKYEYCETYLGNDRIKYDSPAHFLLRDIDPSLSTKHKLEEPKEIKKIFKDQISIKKDMEDLKQWCQSEDIPDPLKLIKRNINNTEYLNLCAYYDWCTKYDKTDDDYEDRKFINFYYFIKGYIIKKQDFEAAKEFLKDKVFFGRWMPEESEYDSVYMGEYPDSDLFQNHYSVGYKWAKYDDFRYHKPNFSMLPLADKSVVSFSRDISLNDLSYSFLIPSPPVIKEMQLKYAGTDCSYINKKGDEVIFNPIIKEIGENALFVKRDIFYSYLKEKDYEIIWTINGEKFVNIGKVDISGVYYYENNEITGNLTIHNFEKFPKYS